MLPISEGGHSCGSLIGFATVTETEPSFLQQLRTRPWAGVKLAVTLTPPNERDACLEQIDKLIDSHVLHGSEALCRMLQYLAQHALDHPGVSVKEYQIATEVFGRPPDFDPHLDATIRVQVGRLRTKLAEYYSTLGSEDPIIVDLPKGTHALSFRHRPPHPGSKSAFERLSGVIQGERAKPQTFRNLLVAVVFLSVSLVASIATIIGLAVTRKAPQPAAPRESEIVPAALQLFWAPFLNGPEEPWLIFSNAPFVGRSETGLRFYNPARDSPDKILEHYTGVGEVFAVRDLEHVFGLLKRRLRVKRGSLFTLDDAKNNDLIFIGSPKENLTLRDIPSTHDFIFQRLSSGPRKGDLAVINVRPQPDEASTFLPPPGPPITQDYSIVALVPGLNPSRSTLILAGTTTVGTQAAAEFVCQPDSIQELLRRLHVSNALEARTFEAVLRVEVKHDVPVETKITALRKGPF